MSLLLVPYAYDHSALIATVWMTNSFEVLLVSRADDSSSRISFLRDGQVQIMDLSGGEAYQVRSSTELFAVVLCFSIGDSLSYDNRQLLDIAVEGYKWSPDGRYIALQVSVIPSLCPSGDLEGRVGQWVCDGAMCDGAML